MVHPIPPPTPFPSADGTPKNAWAPFEDRVAFEFAFERFFELQALEKQVGRGLDLWRAATIKAQKSTNGKDIPWHSAADLYATIDSIKTEHADWMTHTFKYNRPRPNGVAPTWMDSTYELNYRDILELVELQLANPDFKDQFDYVPYREFDPQGSRVWSNLMSGDWAYDEAVCAFFKAYALAKMFTG